jgi:hypothetical protein
MKYANEMASSGMIYMYIHEDRYRYSQAAGKRAHTYTDSKVISYAYIYIF